MIDNSKFLDQYTSGVDLWEHAKQIIPGGGQLLSKKAERFAPGVWPSYYKKAKGYKIWDIKGNLFIDFAQMGVGSCVLGYADKHVNLAVSSAIRDGNMASLNSYEEVILAEKLIELHPWADMARFARTGGEACAIAARIARAASGKDKIAFCGYHGWHDWYISANLAGESHLDGQLLPGLTPAGVPRRLEGTTVTFEYNNVVSVKELEHYKDELGVIFLESVRGTKPTDEFVKAVNSLAKSCGAVLVLDEVTAGFRENLGGWHLNTSFNADMAVFGKALGNGFPISAVIGKRNVMEATTKSFVSSTMWTERIGFVAALATIDQFEKNNIVERLIYNGRRIKRAIIESGENYNINVVSSGIDPLPSFKFLDGEANVYQTYFTREMLNKGYLVGSSIYSSSIYDDKMLNNFENNVSEVFAKMEKIKPTLNDIDNQPIMTSFKRLNG
jgi:glutamate-1-semialdehyde 2,1-aminomutase